MRILNALLFTACILLVYSILKRSLTPSIAFWAALWVLTNPNLLARGSAVTDDVMTGLFGLMAVWITISKGVSPERSGIAGFLCGVAFVSKYTAYMLLPILGPYLYIAAWRNRKQGSKPWLVITCFAAASLLPIVLQAALNWSIYQQPFYTAVQDPSESTRQVQASSWAMLRPDWAIRWMQYYWIDSWTSFYDWTSGYVYNGQEYFKRHLLLIGQVYTAFILAVTARLLLTLYRCWRTLRSEEVLLLALGLAAPLSKFILDAAVGLSYPAIRFGFPYLAGLAFLLPFALTHQERWAVRGRVFLVALVFANAAQIAVGLVRNLSL